MQLTYARRLIALAFLCSIILPSLITRAAGQSSSPSGNTKTSELRFVSRVMKVGDIQFSVPSSWLTTTTSNQSQVAPDRVEIRPPDNSKEWKGYGLNFSFMRPPSATDLSKVDAGEVLAARGASSDS
jgi:hypothetical protein